MSVVFFSSASNTSLLSPYAGNSRSTVHEYVTKNGLLEQNKTILIYEYLNYIYTRLIHG